MSHASSTIRGAGGPNAPRRPRRTLRGAALGLAAALCVAGPATANQADCADLAFVLVIVADEGAGGTEDRAGDALRSPAVRRAFDLAGVVDVAVLWSRHSEAGADPIWRRIRDGADVKALADAIDAAKPARAGGAADPLAAIALAGEMLDDAPRCASRRAVAVVARAAAAVGAPAAVAQTTATGQIMSRTAQHATVRAAPADSVGRALLPPGLLTR